MSPLSPLCRGWGPRNPVTIIFILCLCERCQESSEICRNTGPSYMPCMSSVLLMFVCVLALSCLLLKWDGPSSLYRQCDECSQAAHPPCPQEIVASEEAGRPGPKKSCPIGGLRKMWHAWGQSSLSKNRGYLSQSGVFVGQTLRCYIPPAGPGMLQESH